MDTYKYDKANTDDNDDNENDSNKSWKYFLRQAFVLSTLCIVAFVSGMAVGAPTVFIPQIRKENKNSTEVIDDSMASWLTSIFSFAAIPVGIIMPIIASYCGRKIPFVFTTIIMLIGSIVFYCSKNITQILIGEAMNGIAMATMATVGNGMSISEYTSPKYRGIFFSFKSATFYWGLWLSNAIGTFLNWRLIPLLMTILSIYSVLTVFFWPESPYYLANKSKYDACIKSHRWLKGTNKCAENELGKLLSLQSGSDCEKPTFHEVMRSKRFYKATFLCVCLTTLFIFTGKIACTIYSLDILKKMTSSERTAYTGMLILDGATVFSMYVGSILIKNIRRRVLLLSSTSVGIASLLFLSLYSYLVNSSYLSENKYISIALLFTYSIGLGCGPMIMSISMYGELVPLQYKSLSVCLTVTIDKLVMGTILKFTPLIIKIIGLQGIFLFFGLSSSVCLWLLYLYMPETKDKTLFEISDAIHG